MRTKNSLVLVVAGLVVIIFLALLLTRPGDGEPDNSRSTSPPLPQFDRQGRQTIVTDKSIYKRANHTRRLLARSNPESRSQLQRLIQLLQSGDEMNIVDAMIDAQELDSEDLIDFVKAAMKTQDPDQREEALRMLVGVVNPRVLEVVREAVHDANPELRLAALEALQYVGTGYQEVSFGRDSGDSTAAGGTESTADTPTGSVTTDTTIPGDSPAGSEAEVTTDDKPDSGETADEAEEEAQPEFDYSTLSAYDISSILSILAAAFEDTDVQIRSAALQAILHLSLDVQVQAFALAQKSSYDDVRGGVLFMTATSANYDTLMLAFQALDDSNEYIRQAAKANLQHYLNAVDQDFNSTAEALAWWQQNYHLFDDDLFINNLDNINIDDFIKPNAGTENGTPAAP